MTKPDLTLDEPIATGWLRLQLTGDVDQAKQQIAAGRALLGRLRTHQGVNARIAEGQPGGFYRDFRQLDDGTTIEVLTNDGHDTINIHVPGASQPASTTVSGEGQKTDFLGTPTSFAPEWPETTKSTEPVREVREYCRWNGDSERYSPVYHGHLGIGPCWDGGNRVLFAISDRDLSTYNYPDYAQQTILHTLDFDDLSEIGSEEINYICDGLPTGMCFDAKSGNIYALWRIHINPEPYRYMGLYVFGKDGISSIDLPFDEQEIYSEGTVYDTLIWQRTTDTPLASGAILYNISSGSRRQLNNTSIANQFYYYGYMTASTSPAGDVLVASPMVPWSEFDNVASQDYPILKRFGAIEREYPNPLPVMLMNDGCFFAVQNDETTVWMIMTPNVDGLPQEAQLFRYTDALGNWEPISVEGGFGGPDDTDVYYSGWWRRRLWHDPVSDAICYVLPNMAGLWIFNATDCQGIAIEPFFHPVTEAPFGAMKNYYPTQFYNGALLVNFQVSDYEYVEVNPPYYTNRADFQCGIIEIGILQQSTVTETYLDGVLISMTEVPKT